MMKLQENKIIVYTDGGSRGNPGPAALGVVICNTQGGIIKKYGEALGVQTNNFAEYSAVVFALKKLKQLFGKGKARSLVVEVRMDSEFVVRQLSGQYKIEKKEFFPLFIAIWNLKMDFGTVVFTYVPREKNKEADHMVNEALNAEPPATLL